MKDNILWGILKMLCNIKRRLRKVENQMADLKSAEQGVEQSESDLEARVTAHEAADAAQAAHDAEVAADLQKQIDELTAKLGDQDATVVALTALKAKMDGFDATAPPAP